MSDETIEKFLSRVDKEFGKAKESTNRSRKRKFAEETSNAESSAESASIQLPEPKFLDLKSISPKIKQTEYDQAKSVWETKEFGVFNGLRDLSCLFNREWFDDQVIMKFLNLIKSFGGLTENSIFFLDPLLIYCDQFVEMGHYDNEKFIVMPYH